MDNIQKYIKDIINSDNATKKEKLNDMFSEIMERMKYKNPCDYKEKEKELYEIAEGKVLNKEKASEIIKKMKPKGQKWTLEETESVRISYNYVDIRPIDFWVVMNMAYNDYYNLMKDNIEMYAKFSELFIKDEDADENKVYNYFMSIPKE